MKESIDFIQSIVFDLGRKINAPRNLLMVHDRPLPDGAPYIEINNDSIFVVSSERGFELFRELAPSVDEVIYIIIERAISRMALDYEINNRVEGQDFRRIYFKKKIELMSLINDNWAERVLEDVNKILSESPYADS